MSHTYTRFAITGMALGLLAPMATPMAQAADQKTAWGAATVGAAVGAVVEVSKDHPLQALGYAAGAALSYNQYAKARQAEDDRNVYDDTYGYRDTSPRSRPYGSGSHPYARYDRGTREVAGYISKTPNSWDRKVKVQLDDGTERTIDVPNGIAVRRYGRAISMHDLKRDEYVRIQIRRFYEDGDLEARRLDVYDNGRNNDRYDRNDRYNRNNPYDDTYGYRGSDQYDRRNDDRYDRNSGNNSDNGQYYDNAEVTGRVTSIDSGEGILRLDADGRRITVYTDRAAISDDQGSIRLRDLQSGDRVTVEGRQDGDVVYATRVTVR